MENNNTQDLFDMNENKAAIDTIIMALSDITVDYTKYNAMQNDIIEMTSVINTIKNENVKNAMISEREKMQKLAEIEHDNAYKNAVISIISIVYERLGINTITSKMAKTSNPGKNAKNEYTVKMAILDNLDNDFIPLKTLCDRIEKQDKLPSIHKNDGWKRTISTALIT